MSDVHHFGLPQTSNHVRHSVRKPLRMMRHVLSCALAAEQRDRAVGSVASSRRGRHSL